MDDPVCGVIDSTVDSFSGRILTYFGIIGSITGVVALLKVLFGIDSFLALVADIAAILAIGSAAGVGAVFGLFVVVIISGILFVEWLVSCVLKQPGEERCVSGVVVGIEGESIGAVFNAEHPSIIVALKTRYWPFVILNAARVGCHEGKIQTCRVVYKSSKVCAARFGAFLGSLIAGGAAIAAAYAIVGFLCITVILCWLAILLAVFVVAAAAIAGALAGGALAAASKEDTLPAAESGAVINLGDLVSTTGPMARNENYGGTIVQQFNSRTVLMGRLSFPGISLTADIVDDAIPDFLDPCGR